MKDMGNWSELHLKEVTCYKILILVDMHFDTFTKSPHASAIT